MNAVSSASQMQSDGPLRVAADVVIKAKHVDLGPDDTYHEWVGFGERVKADVNGSVNPYMRHADWQRWICNNTSCPASALVPDSAVVELILCAE